MKLASAILAFGLSTPVLGWDTSWPQPHDFPFLPPYCRALLQSGQNSPEYAKWVQELGDGFGSTHHYCAGLNFARRVAGKPRNSIDFQASMRQAITEMSYTVDRAPPTYPLMPEMLTQRGRAYAQTGRVKDALTDFYKAIELKQTYVPAYLALSDMYVQSNMFKDAKEVLDAGLAIAPGSTELRVRLAQVEAKASAARK